MLVYLRSKKIIRNCAASRALDEAPLAHPAHLDGLALLEDYGNRMVAAGELEHPLVGISVLLYVVLHEVHSTPLQILAGGRAIGTTCCGIEMYRVGYTLSSR
jgi:hypothetical protein